MKTTTKAHQTLASVIRDLRRDCGQMADTDVAYDLGYAMALCNSLGRKRLADLVLNRFEHLAF